MTYFLLDRFFANHPCRLINSYPFIKGARWSMGRRIDEALIPNPLEIHLEHLDPNSGDQGPEMPEYFKGQIPIFRDDFISAFKETGISNFQEFPLKLTDPDDGKIYTNYKAINIIGELPKEALELTEETPPHDHAIANIEKYNIDGLHVFRVKDAVGIFVSNKLKEHLLAKGYNDLDFLSIEESAV